MYSPQILTKYLVVKLPLSQYVLIILSVATITQGCLFTDRYLLTPFYLYLNTCIIMHLFLFN